jgi:hypothetical protein
LRGLFVTGFRRRRRPGRPRRGAGRLRADGVDVAAFKPVVTGLDEPEG